VVSLCENKNEGSGKRQEAFILAGWKRYIEGI